ncbi:MAG TPA: FAD:protein FMN transferase [Holophaga sp.]|nr:FAD:protein FMN transferase [Holophaga sp.]
MKARIGFLLGAALILGLFGVYGRTFRTYHELSTTLLAMGGVEIEVKAYGANRRAFAQAVSEIEARFRGLEARLTRFRPASDIGRINAAAGGGPVDVHEDTLRVLLQAQGVAQASHRAFDVSVLPLLQLWKDSAQAQREPTGQEIASALARVDAARIVIDSAHRTVQIPGGMAVDLGGIGQGLFADEGVRILRAHGILRGLVNASGEVAVFDDRPQPEPFAIGILDPRTGGQGGVVRLVRGAVATSGSYRRGVEVSGRHRSHILDPLSGRPADGTLSVTVEGPSALEADAWSTACAVLASRGMDPRPFLPPGFRLHALVSADPSRP